MCLVHATCRVSSRFNPFAGLQFFFQFDKLSHFAKFQRLLNHCFEPGQYYLVRAFQHCFAFRPQIWRNPHGWCSDFDPSRRMPNYFQNSDHQYRIIDFCLRWKYGHGTQCRTCAASTNYRIRMNKTKMPAILFKYHGTAKLRCAPLSCPKRGDLVREPHNAARNRCNATCWLDHCGDQAHSAQR